MTENQEQELEEIEKQLRFAEDYLRKQTELLLGFSVSASFMEDLFVELEINKDIKPASQSLLDVCEHHGIIFDEEKQIFQPRTTALR